MWWFRTRTAEANPQMGAREFRNKKGHSIEWPYIHDGGASENLCEPYDSRERARNQSLH